MEYEYGVTDPQVGDVIIWDDTTLTERRERVVREVTSSSVFYEGGGAGSSSLSSLADPSYKYRRKDSPKAKKKGFAAWVKTHP